MLNARGIVGVVVLTLLWGVNWPVMKFSLREMGPLHFRALVVTIGWALLLVWFLARGTSLRLPRQMVGKVALLMLPNIIGWNVGSIFGVAALASGRAAILGFTMPIWAVLIGLVVFRERVFARQWFAVACAAGAVLLLLWHELGAMSGAPVGMLWMLGAALSWATGTQLMKRMPLKVSTEALTVWMLGMSLPLFWAFALWFEPQQSWSISGGVVIAVLCSGVGAVAVAQILWFSTVRQLPPVASALSVMMVPVVGLLSAMPITGERPHVQDYAAVVLILLALAAALLPRRAG